MTASARPAGVAPKTVASCIFACEFEQLGGFLPLFEPWHRSCSKKRPGTGVEPMREKAEPRARALESRETELDRLRSDLESRGVDPAISQPLARRLLAIVPDLSESEYAALLAGVSTAAGFHPDRSEPRRAGPRPDNELRRLMEGFTGELRKLDEGLQLLSTYLVRMGALSSRKGRDRLH